MDPRLAELATAWLAERGSDHTRAAYSRDLAAFTEWCAASGCDPLRARPADLDAYRDACLADACSAATVARRLSAIASFFRHAVGAGATDGNPAESVDRPEGPDGATPPALDDRELDGLLDAARRLGPKTAALVALLALDGLKLKEALAVNIPHVRLAAPPSVGVERHGTRHAVPITSHSAELVGAQIAERRRGPLFLGDSVTSEQPARLTRFGADYLIKRAGAAAELAKSVSANVLRRSYVEAARRAGTSLAEIANQLGHRQVRETARLLDGGSSQG